MENTNPQTQNNGQPIQPTNGTTPPPQPVGQNTPVVPNSAVPQPQQPVQPAVQPVQQIPQAQPQPVGQTVAGQGQTQPIQQAPTGTANPQAPIIRTTNIKRGRKINPRIFAIGCIGFIVLLVAMIFAAGYIGIQNPRVLSTIGMTPAQAKTMLLIVAGAFFGILFVVSSGFLILNVYRLMKAKNSPKGRFIVGAIISFIMLSISVGAGAGALLRINKINVDTVFSKNLVIGYVAVFKGDSNQATYEEIEKPGITVIGPVEVYMKVNSTFRYALATQLGTNNINSLKLSCGNGTGNRLNKIIDGAGVYGQNGGNPTSDMFAEPCLYINKGTYKLEVTYTYFDSTTQQSKQGKMDVGTIIIPAAMTIKNDGKIISTNSGNTEMLAGDSPARLVFDAKNLSTDLGLVKDEIVWDLDGDGKVEDDKTNKTFFSYTYDQSRFYRIKYRLPSNPTYPLYYYNIPLRVLQSDIPMCTVTTTAGKEGYMTFQGSWQDGGTEVDGIGFEVYNLTKESIIQPAIISSTNKPSFEYRFRDLDKYIVRLVFRTIEGKKGFCESPIINENSSTYALQTTFLWKTEKTNSYQTMIHSGVVSVKGDTITSTYAPFDLQVRIDGSTPSIPAGSTVSVLIDDEAMSTVKANLYSARLYGSNPKILKIIVNDTKGNTSETVWNIQYNQDELVGDLLADKITGPQPLVVNFDASTISATRAGDSIIYYSWDFGDGKNAPNVTQSKMAHTYGFNMTKTGNIAYKPSVTITTQQGHTQTFGLANPISVTREATNVNILIPSHPAQIAKVGNQVQFSIETDGYITATTWDFGDGTPEMECDFRACIENKHLYTNPGTYTVRVTVDYQGLPSATNTIAIKITN